MKKQNKLFICEACKLSYKDEKTASQCEEFCNKYKSCNLELIKKAVNVK